MIFFSLLVNTSIAQNKYFIRPENADCNNAIELTDTIWGPTNAPEGYGQKMEIAGHKKSIYFFEKEHNTVWYTFVPTFNCTLTLDIFPECVEDDYDFILFEETGKNFCDIIKLKKPIRSNISRNNKKLNSNTGLAFNKTNNYVHSGLGEGYSNAVEVKKDVRYYLVLDNVYENGKGHIIYLNYKECNKEKGKISLNINVISEESKELINANIDIYTVDRLGSEEPYKRFEDISSCFFAIKPQKKYNIYISANEYLGFSKQIETGFLAGNISIKAELEKIVVGENIVLENIYFYGNEYRFLPKSYITLENLYLSLKENPTVKIEIHGHINGPNMAPDFNMQLSVDRAKAVCKYLTGNGIDTARLSFKGFANNEMLYPHAVTEEEMEKNRRVEIVVLSK